MRRNPFVLAASIILITALVGCWLILPRQAQAGYEQTSEHQVQRVWLAPYFLDGSGYKIAMWDGGLPFLTHNELFGRVLVGDNTSDNVDHATHIAGILIATGVSPSEPTLTRAAAFRAFLKSWDISDAPDEFSDAVAEGIPVGNNSWGKFIGWWWDPIGGTQNPGWRDSGGQDQFGAYQSETRTFDQAIYDAAQLGATFFVTFAAGDDRHQGPGNSHNDGTWYPEYDHVNPYFDCINPMATGKNVVTVGATGSGPDEDSVAYFSCWGPTDDGRIKPDLLARGQAVYSSRVSGSALYGSLSGTGQASAAVSSSSVLLMQQFGRTFGASPSTAEIKGVLLNNAEDRGPAGPDYLYGFGFLDVLAAVDNVVFDGGNRTMIRSDSVADAGVVSYDMFVSGDAPIRITLTWIDPPGSLAAPEAIINDLDLRLIAPGGATHYPYRLSFSDPGALATASGPNPVDTVEQVVVADPIPGIWQVEVAGTSVPIDSPQSYALVSNTVLNPGAPEPAGIEFARNADGSSVDIAWNLVTDPDLVEYRIFRSDDISNTLELIAVVPAGTTTYTDLTPPNIPVVAYDVRSVFNRGSVRAISTRLTAVQTATPVVLSPQHGGEVVDGEITILGRAEPGTTVMFYENPLNPVLLATREPGPNGLFYLEHDFGGTGTYQIFVQADTDDAGISIPSLDAEFLIVP